MGKQSARLYYQGKDHCDLVCHENYGSNVPTTGYIDISEYTNHYQLYKGNQLYWERMPANIVATNIQYIFTSNDLVHFSTMRYGISAMNENKRYHATPIFLDVLNKWFVCGCVNVWTTKEIKILLLRSKDGFKWEKFYEETEIATFRKIIMCEYNGEECVALYSGHKLKYFNSNFELIDSVDVDLINVSNILGYKTLYILGKNERSIETIEEYRNGVLEIKHTVGYNELIQLSNYHCYMRGDDHLYEYDTNFGSSAFQLLRYKGGEYEFIICETNDSNLKGRYISHADLYDDALIFIGAGPNYKKFYRYKNGVFVLIAVHDDEPFVTIPIIKKNGITAYSFSKRSSGLIVESGLCFTKSDYFSISDYGSIEYAKAKGFTQDINEGISSATTFAYLPDNE